MKSKAISLLLIACLLLSGMNVSAVFSDDEQIPEVGVLIDYDMEGWSNPSDMIFSRGKGGKLYSAGGEFGNSDGNQFWKPAVEYNELKYALRDISNKANTEVIDTGKLKFEYDVRVPKGEDMADNESSILYLQFMNYSGYHEGKNNGRAYMHSISYQNDCPKLILGVNDVGWAAPQPAPDGSNVVDLNFDEWYTVTTIIDYDLREVNYYLNGSLVNHYAGDAKNVKTQFAFYCGGFTQGGTTKNVANIDNLLIERLGDGVLAGSVSEVGDNTVSVSFSSTVDAGIKLNPEDYSLNILGEDSSVKAIDAAFSDGTLKLTFADDFYPNTNYVLTLNASLYETGNPGKVLKYGKKLLFLTAASPVDMIVTQQNFDSIDFPTESTSAEFKDFYYEGRKAADGVIDTENDFIAQPEKSWDYTDAVEKADSSDKMLRFNFDDNYPSEEGNIKTYHKNLVFPFGEGQSVKSGILTYEFDLEVPFADGVNEEQLDIGFGLHDSEKEETKFDYNKTFANATMFAGIGYYEGAVKALSYGISSRGNRFATRYQRSGKESFDSTVRGRNAAWWKDDAMLAEVTPNSTNKYKIAVDIDNKTYSIYFNGELKATMNFIPGGGEKFSYDAVVFAFVGNKTESATPSYAYIDNLKVTHTVPALNAASGISFEKYDGTVYEYGDLLPAGTKKIKLDFKNEIDESSVDGNIEIDGAGEDYTANVSGKSIELEFDNCLAANTEYRITVKSGLTDTGGTVLGRDITFTASTDDGEVIYNNPVILVNGSSAASASAIAPGDTITVEAEVINTTKNKKGAYAVLYAYKDSALVGAAFTRHYADSSSPYHEIIEIRHTADAGFVGADSIKAFVFDNASDLMPLTDATVID